MANYESFGKARRKIEKAFEKTRLNLSEVKNQNIQKFQEKYKSENHYKPVTIIPIVSNYTVDTPGQQVTVDLLDFPEWAINMARPSVVLYFDSAIQPHEEVDSFFTAFANGTLTDGTLSIIRWNISHWFTKQDGLYKFTVRFDLNPRIATGVSEFGFGSTAVPTYANVSLYILNERNYNDLQSGK